MGLEKAIENGIKTEYVLNEKAIISALKKQIPKKPLDGIDFAGNEYNVIAGREQAPARFYYKDTGQMQARERKGVTCYDC